MLGRRGDVAPTGRRAVPHHVDAGDGALCVVRGDADDAALGAIAGEVRPWSQLRSHLVAGLYSLLSADDPRVWRPQAQRGWRLPQAARWYNCKLRALQ